MRRTALEDFYIQYTLLVCLENAQQRSPTLDALHANILDAFNEYGVQITSPNYEADPEAPQGRAGRPVVCGSRPCRSGRRAGGRRVRGPLVRSPQPDEEGLSVGVLDEQHFVAGSL